MHCSTFAAAKEEGQQRAMNKMKRAQSDVDVNAAAQMALLLGASVLMVEAAKKMALARLVRFAGAPVIGGRGFGGGHSSGTFGGFGGGHFGGGGGGAKW